MARFILNENQKQTRKLAAGCSKYCFEVVDETDEVSNHIYGKAKLTWFEEIFEEYQLEERVTNTLCGFFISIKMVK